MFTSHVNTIGCDTSKYWMTAIKLGMTENRRTPQDCCRLLTSTGVSKKLAEQLILTIVTTLILG